MQGTQGQAGPRNRGGHVPGFGLVHIEKVSNRVDYRRGVHNGPLHDRLGGKVHHPGIQELEALSRLPYLGKLKCVRADVQAEKLGPLPK